MKITNISIAQESQDDSRFPRIFGLGDDNFMYEWDHLDGGWYLSINNHSVKKRILDCAN